MKVAYSFDDNYAVQAGVSILSLLEHHKEVENLVIYVIDNHISTTNKKNLDNMVACYGRVLEYISIEILTYDLKCLTAFNRSAYARLFLAKKLLADRIIYIDSDTIINGSLERLQTWNLTDILVAGVADTVNLYYRQLIGLDKNDRYICSGGVILLNLKLWRERNITSKCIEFIRYFNGIPPHNDQGTINYVCRGYIDILPAAYNVMSPMFAFSTKRLKRLFVMREYYSQKEIGEAIRRPLVLHYTDEFYNRPWFDNCTHPLKQIWLRYFSQSPWYTDVLPTKRLSRNCKIQNFVYRYLPFPFYLLMVRFITWKHLLLSHK